MHTALYRHVHGLSPLQQGCKEAFSGNFTAQRPPHALEEGVSRRQYVCDVLCVQLVYELCRPGYDCKAACCPQPNLLQVLQALKRLHLNER
jgi:hypothetical protein